MNDNNDDKLDEFEFYLISLLSVILDDSQNYPNINHIETISNAEKFITLIFNDYNEIKLKYKIGEDDIYYNKIELFGNIFINNNKQNCFLIINKKILELNRFINLNDIFDIFPKDYPIQLNAQLIERKDKIMKDLSFMFYNILTLTESNFSEYDTKNIKKMNYMFYNCSSLKKLSDSIASFTTTEVDDMSFMFYNCSSIKELPNISTFNTENVITMSHMFYNCSALKILPDISNWNLAHVVDMSNMFENCISLENPPEISKWNISSLKYFNGIFKNCKSLINLPDLSNWKLKEAPNNKEMFEGCELLRVKSEFKNKCNLLCCLKSFMKNINCCFYYFCSILIILIVLISALIFLFSPHIPLYYSFHLKKIEKSFFKPKEILNLENIIDIAYISSINNIINISSSQNISENKEVVIYYLLDKIIKERNISFKTDLNNFKIYSIINEIDYILNIAFFVIFIIFVMYDIDLYKVIIIQSIILLLYIVSIIFQILDMIVIQKLIYSVKFFYTNLEKYFKIIIPLVYFDEIKYLEYSNEAIIMCFFTFIILPAVTIGICKAQIENWRESSIHNNII